MTSLRPIPVQNPEQIELVRIIRNVQSAGFSHFNGQIAERDHLSWWHETKPQAWLFADERTEVVGFGLLRKDDLDRWATVVAVVPGFTGHGYGSWITHFIVEQTPGRCYATARLDNPAAMALHHPRDWQRIEGEDDRLAYYVTWPRYASAWPGQEAREQWAEAGWVAT